MGNSLAKHHAARMAGCKPLLRLVGVSDHRDPDRLCRPARLLRAFLHAPRVAHSARLLFVTDRLVVARTGPRVVCRFGFFVPGECPRALRRGPGLWPTLVI